MTGKNTTTILYVLLAVILTLQVKSCFFDKEHKPEQMIRNEERLKYLEEKRLADSLAFQQRIAWYDSSLTASQNRVVDLENKKQPIYNAIKNTKVTVPNYTKQQLADESAAYYKQYGN